MKPLWAWVLANPQAFRAFFVTFLGMLFKLILQFSGRNEQLAHWNDAAAQVLDLAVYLIMGWGAIVGGVHAAQGPALSNQDQAVTIIAALQPASVAAAAEEVKTTTQQLAAVEPVTQAPEVHRF